MLDASRAMVAEPLPLDTIADDSVLNPLWNRVAKQLLPDTTVDDLVTTSQRIAWRLQRTPIIVVLSMCLWAMSPD